MTHPDQTVRVPRRVAETINDVFLPSNPNKMRSPHPDVLAAVLAFKDALAAAPSPEAEGAVHPTIRAAQERGNVSFATRRLMDAAQALADSCCLADTREELPEEIDGSLIDAVNEALASLQRPQTTAELSGNTGELDATISRIQSLANVRTVDDVVSDWKAKGERVAVETTAPDSGLVDRLVEALEPFAKLSGQFSGVMVEVCDPHPGNPSPRIQPMMANDFARAAQAVTLAQARNGAA